MKFNTDLYYVSGMKDTSRWCLWFTEVNGSAERNNVVNCLTFPVKPTKKQIRKHRRLFRENIERNIALEELLAM